MHRGLERVLYATAAALALAQNEPQAQVVWCRGADLFTIEMACKMAAVRAFEEGIDPAVNLDYRKFKAWRGPFTPSDKITIPEAAAGLNNGLTSVIDSRSCARSRPGSRTRSGPGLSGSRHGQGRGPGLHRGRAGVGLGREGLPELEGPSGLDGSEGAGQGPDPDHRQDWILTWLYQAQNQRPIVLEGVDDLRDAVVVTLGNGRAEPVRDGDVP